MSVLDFPRTVLPIPERIRVGLTTDDAKDSDTGFAPIESGRPPAGSPNVLLVLLDDIGFGASRTFGGPCTTPNGVRLAAQGLNALGYLGLLELERGQLRAAQVLADEGLEIAQHRGWSEPTQAILIHLVLAMVHLERNELGESRRLLDAGLAAQRNDPEPVPLLALQVAQARLLLAGGHVDRARAVLTELGAAAEGWEPPALIRQWLAVIEAEIDLAAGRPGSVFERVRPFLVATGGTAERVSVVTARAELALGHTAEVDTILAPLREKSKNPVATVEAWLVTALAADHLRNDHRALTALERALTIAEPEDIRRPFLAFGHPRLDAMLRHVRRLTTDRGHFAEDLLAELDTSDQAAVPSSPLIKPLTDREQIVLRHLATLQTNGDIGGELYISVNTVKTHVRSVYRKLAVANRREAVSRACELGLF
jgi:LuxR family transcriptional regulator, maltose regulon positive regulatory protein